MRNIVVKKELCHKDHLCVNVCPVRCLAPDENGVPVMKEDKESSCLECGHCQAICPHQALTFIADSLIYDECIPGEMGHLENLIKTRRSIRKYKSEPLGQQLIQKALELTQWSPTAKNERAVHFSVVTGYEKIKDIGDLVVESFKQKNKLPGMIRAWESGKDFIFRKAPHLVVVWQELGTAQPTIDPIIALTHLDLALNDSGAGTCWAGFFMSESEDDAIKKFFEVPSNGKIIGALMFGRPAYRYKGVPPRKPFKINFI